MNNTARGKMFNFIQFVKKTEEKGDLTVLMTTQDGLLYFINYYTRQVEKVI